MSNTYWKEFYKKDEAPRERSSFADYVRPFIHGNMIELGSGNGRDWAFFSKTIPFEVVGIDKATGVDVADYVKTGECKFDYVYTRFFWHSISRQLQLQILKWTKKWIFIEARTTQDEDKPKVYFNHPRNYVDVGKLISDLKANGFEIIEMKEGVGFSPFKYEDPHLVRVVAKKVE